MIETIEWVPVAERLPDDEITVFLWTEGGNEEAWPGWRVGNAWRWSDGAPVEYDVTHWAEWPKGPRA